jgi:hypothetical protein
MSFLEYVKYALAAFGPIYGFFDDTGQGDFAPTGVATPQECLRNLVTRVGLYGLAERFDEFAVLMGYLLGRPGAAVVSRNVTATLPNPRQERQTDRQEGFRLPEIMTLSRSYRRNMVTSGRALARYETASRRAPSMRIFTTRPWPWPPMRAWRRTASSRPMRSALGWGQPTARPAATGAEGNDRPKRRRPRPAGLKGARVDDKPKVASLASTRISPSSAGARRHGCGRVRAGSPRPGWRFPPRCPRSRDPAVLRGRLRDHPRAQGRARARV